ncbi:hypothetical protein [Myxacorys almedinensis]|uniref:Uncharacterized protein n=1 Tax=Myxacorys almedinensis A TaxID=2690445 RepID=A0A8J8CJ68_9CYAN|nr:hypothetical protein [Myxacorys almedinensis]NDJ18349.1 hypothetical protein [Myxacorys almedinensis A]
MTPEPMRLLKLPKPLTVLLTVLLPLAAIAAIDLLPYFQYKYAYSQMNSHIRKGMNLDDAMFLLKREGFQVGEKYTPPGTKNIYLAEVILVNHVPITITLLNAIGMKTDFYPTEVLEAGADNKIRRTVGVTDFDM